MRTLKKLKISILAIVVLIPLTYSQTFEISKSIIYSTGDLITISTKENASDIFTIASYNTNIKFPFYQISNIYISFIPIPPEVMIKSLPITVLDKKNNIIFQTNVILDYVDKIKEKPRKLKLTKHSKQVLKEKEKIAKDTAYILSTINGINRNTFINSSIDFVLPSSNRITSSFGVSRLYPDGRIRYHRGIDFSYEPDDNVYAVGSGIVVISSNFIANGESIYIYHGNGIISSYFHLKERHVNVGEKVNKGQIIGKIGQTGISTSPHLHLGMYILGIGGYVAFDPSVIMKMSKSQAETNHDLNSDELD
ncbi:MAG: M23 family metallopeptidase [Brevinematales bacterium]|nr:M23 family metallopeptidase [Brevinematales bacterium]